MKEYNYLATIEDIFEGYAQEHRENKNIVYYHDISIEILGDKIDCFESKHFIQIGKHRTQFLYRFNDVRAYFTDVDILTMLLQAKETPKFQKIIEGLMKWLKGVTEEAYVILDDKKYSFRSIIWNTDDVYFNTSKDIMVSEWHLLALINLIISKDIAATNLAKEEDNGDKYDFAIRTIKKYIVLLKWYGLQDSKAEEQLKSIGYDTTKTLSEAFAYDKIKEWKGMDLRFQEITIE